MAANFNDQFLSRAAYLFLQNGRGPFSFIPTAGGINNFVYYCDCADGTRLVLRVYNNGGNQERVRMEHQVLNFLKLEASGLSFAIPTPLPVLLNPSSTFAMLDNIPISMFELIAGQSPEVTHPFEFGKAAGELSAVLGIIYEQHYYHRANSDGEDVTTCYSLTTCPTRPYYELYNVHSAITRDLFYSTLGSSEFDAVRSDADYCLQQIMELESKLDEMHQLNFPMQLIHGDLVYNNVLANVENGNITGLIDFEFAAIDWRAMELAICLSKYAGESNAWTLFQQFVYGYSHHASLSRAEVENIPQLVALRLLSNVIYFVGRSIAGEDSATTLIARLGVYVKRLQLLQERNDDIVRMCAEYFRC